MHDLESKSVENENREKLSSLSRRRFLAASVAGAIGVALAGAALWPIGEYLAPTGGGMEEEKVTIPRSQVGVGQAHYFNFRGRPAVVLQPDPGQFIALSVVCTHLGCVIKWQQDQQFFLCPCHAGKFSKTGQVLGGPPAGPLPSYPVAAKADQLVIG